jgi:hypothetical protein
LTGWRWHQPPSSRNQHVATNSPLAQHAANPSRPAAGFPRNSPRAANARNPCPSTAALGHCGQHHPDAQFAHQRGHGRRVGVAEAVAPLDGHNRQQPVADRHQTQFRQDQPVHQGRVAAVKPEEERGTRRHDRAGQEAKQPRGRAPQRQSEFAAGPADFAELAGRRRAERAVQKATGVADGQQRHQHARGKHDRQDPARRRRLHAVQFRPEHGNPGG